MYDIKVLGISGKKQSGKSSAANYVLGLFFQKLEISNETKITPSGRLWVSDIFGNTQHQGIFDPNYKSLATQEFLQEHIYPFIKIYNFADLLKTHICIDILGLSYEQCFGSDEDKNSLTHIKWGDLPVIPPDHDLNSYMTAREIMQYVGTKIFRKMYKNVWVDATLRKICKENSTMAIISDVRFPNEVESIKNAKSPMVGKVIRFTRDPFYKSDTDDSEIALDEYTSYDYVIDNQNMTIHEKNQALYEWLDIEKWRPHRIPINLIRKLVE